MGSRILRTILNIVQALVAVVIAVVVVIGILVVTGAVTTTEPVRLAKRMDRILNAALLILALLESGRAARMVQTGYMLGLNISPPFRRPRHTFYMYQARLPRHHLEDTASPLEKERRRIEEAYLWVDTEHADWHSYAPFGYLPRSVRSPLSLFVLGLLQLTGIVGQACLCYLSFRSPRVSSYANGFLPLFLISAICHVLTYLLAFALNRYHLYLIKLRSAKFTIPQYRNYRYFSHIATKKSKLNTPLPAFLKK